MLTNCSTAVVLNALQNSEQPEEIVIEEGGARLREQIGELWKVVRFRDYLLLRWTPYIGPVGLLIALALGQELHYARWREQSRPGAVRTVVPMARIEEWTGLSRDTIERELRKPAIQNLVRCQPGGPATNPKGYRPSTWQFFETALTPIDQDALLSALENRGAQQNLAGAIEQLLKIDRGRILPMWWREGKEQFARWKRGPEEGIPFMPPNGKGAQSTIGPVLVRDIARRAVGDRPLTPEELRAVELLEAHIFGDAGHGFGTVSWNLLRGWAKELGPARTATVILIKRLAERRGEGTNGAVTIPGGTDELTCWLGYGRTHTVRDWFPPSRGNGTTSRAQALFARFLAREKAGSGESPAMVLRALPEPLPPERETAWLLATAWQATLTAHDLERLQAFLEQHNSSELAALVLAAGEAEQLTEVPADVAELIGKLANGLRSASPATNDVFADRPPVETDVFADRPPVETDVFADRPPVETDVFADRPPVETDVFADSNRVLLNKVFSIAIESVNQPTLIKGADARLAGPSPLQQSQADESSVQPVLSTRREETANQDEPPRAEGQQYAARKGPRDTLGGTEVEGEREAQNQKGANDGEKHGAGVEKDQEGNRDWEEEYARASWNLDALLSACSPRSRERLVQGRVTAEQCVGLLIQYSVDRHVRDPYALMVRALVDNPQTEAEPIYAGLARLAPGTLLALLSPPRMAGVFGDEQIDYLRLCERTPGWDEVKKALSDERRMQLSGWLAKGCRDA